MAEMDLNNLFAKPPVDTTAPEPEPKAVELEEGNTASHELEMKNILGHMAAIEKEYFGLSNVPISHIYYTVLRPRLQELQEIKSRG